MNTTVALSNGEGTFYPAATECYRDPSISSCFLFGNSGSGVLRKFTPDKYAFTGPLSMSKSCDQIWIVDKQITYSAENPGIFTDAYCYLPWIAGMYGMKMPPDYATKPSCSRTVGSRENIEQSNCVGQDAENQDRGRCLLWESEGFASLEDCLAEKPLYNNSGTGKQRKKCDFTYNYTYIEDGQETSFIWDKCRLFAQEGYAYNIYMCKVVFYPERLTSMLLLQLQDSGGNNMTCANNCRGVNPNSVIIGGGAVLAAATVGGLGYLAPVGAVGAAAAAGGTAALMASMQCPRSRPCRVRIDITGYLKVSRAFHFWAPSCYLLQHLCSLHVLVSIYSNRIHPIPTILQLSEVAFVCRFDPPAILDEGCAVSQ